MVLLLIALIIVLGVAALQQSVRGDQLQSENEYLRWENQSLRNEVRTGYNSGTGCGSVLGILVGLGVLLLGIYTIVVLLG